MHKTLTPTFVVLVILILMLPIVTFAQSSWSLGFSVGGEIPRPTTLPSDASHSLAIENDVVWGIVGRYRMSEMISIDAKAAFSRANARLSSIANLIAAYQLDWIEIPFSATISFPTEHVTPFLAVGPCVSFKLSESKEWGPGVIHDDRIRDDFSSADLSLLLGGGVSIPLGSHINISAEGKFCLAFTNAYIANPGHQVRLSYAIFDLNLLFDI